MGPGRESLIGRFVCPRRKRRSSTNTGLPRSTGPTTTGTSASYRLRMRTVRLCSKSTPFNLSMNVVTKCLRVCSPSVTISMPASSWSASSRRIASRLPSSRRSPSRSQGAQSFLGSASQPGLGRLPAMVVCSSKGLRARSEVPRGEAAADVDLGTITVADQLEAVLARGAVGGDPVADLGRAVADGRQALVQEIDQRALLAFLEMADALAVERLVDLAHGRLSDRVGEAPGSEDRHADVFRVSAHGFGEHRSPLQAAPHARVGRLEIVDDDGNDRGQGIEPAPPQRNAKAVIERQVVRYRGLEVAFERGLQDVIRELRVSRDLLVRAVLHPRLGRALVLLAHADADARPVVDEEIHPVIGGDLDKDVGLCGLDASAELGQRPREFALIRRFDVFPAADAVSSV